MPDFLGGENGDGETRIGKKEGPLLQMYEAGKAHCRELYRGNAKVWNVQKGAQDMFSPTRREKGDGFSVDNVIDTGRSEAIIIEQFSRDLDK